MHEGSNAETLAHPLYVRSPCLLRAVLDRPWPGRLFEPSCKIRLRQGSNRKDDHERIQSAPVPTFAITTKGVGGSSDLAQMARAGRSKLEQVGSRCTHPMSGVRIARDRVDHGWAASVSIALVHKDVSTCVVLLVVDWISMQSAEWLAETQQRVDDPSIGTTAASVRSRPIVPSPWDCGL